MLTMLFLGLLIGWAVTGTADYFHAKRVYRRGFQAGHDNALRQVSSW